MRPEIGLSALLLSTLAMVATGQEPLVRVNTRLVEVDVVVRSKDHAVTGLTKEDFSITDKGKPQTIATFRVIEKKNRPVNATLPARMVGGRVVSNRLTNSEDEAAGVTILLIDRLNTADSDQAEVRRALLHYLETAGVGERMALYSLNKTLRVVQDFTGDPERLRKSVFARGSPESSVDLTADLFAEDLPVTGDALTDAMTHNSANEMKDFAIKNRVNITAYALELIAKHLAGLPGRKKLVWFTSAFPASYTSQGSRNGMPQIENRQFADEIEKAARALNDANVAVYPVDPRNPIDGGFTAPGIDTMNLFAGKTGGRAFYVLSDLEAPIRTIGADDEVTYMLGFYPSDKKLDGTFHPISVKVAKSGIGSGIEVRHRKGYFASELKPLNDQQRQSSLNDVFVDPLEATGIGLVARATPDAGEVGVYNLDVFVNVGELHLEREKDRWVALISIATQFSAKKKPNGTREDIKISLTEDRLRQVLSEGGYFIRRPFAAGDLKGELRVVVQDRVSGEAGSVRLPIGIGD